MLRALLSKRLIYYFWPEDINQSHCSVEQAKRLFWYFVRRWMDDGRGASAGRANRSVDNDKQVGKEKLLQFSAIFGWPTETLSDDKTCRSASVRRTAIGNVRARAMMRHKHMVNLEKIVRRKWISFLYCYLGDA